jgi:hypothetical protein
MINTYQIQVNESQPLGQSILALLKSASDVVSFDYARNDKLHKNLKSGFSDVREIIDGKQERTTINDFINELRNNSNHLRQKRARHYISKGSRTIKARKRIGISTQ